MANSSRGSPNTADHIPEDSGWSGPAEAGSKLLGSGKVLEIVSVMASDGARAKETDLGLRNEDLELHLFRVGKSEWNGSSVDRPKPRRLVPVGSVQECERYPG